VTGLERFPPTLAAAQARIAAVRPGDYARTRNALDGAATGLSPYFTHGFVTLPEALAQVAGRHALNVQHKLVYEFGWREYFRHVWRHRGEAIFDSLHAGLLPENAYARELPDDLRQARTGVPVIDLAVRTLYATGYLHNHTRMWLASYVVHLRKIHWRTGADWMYAHLLDGDLASNHLSWQWVAGTASRKPYLFNADNVARFAPAPWHSPGSVIDTSYESLEAIARSPEAVAVDSSGEGISEPALHNRPADISVFSEPDADVVAGRDVWLVHPWSLRAPPRDLPANTLLLGVLLTDFHERWRWNAARWEFVMTRMQALAPSCRIVDAGSLAEALSQARSVRTKDDPHIAPLLCEVAACVASAPLFAEIDRPCASFSQWWACVTRGVERLEDLPGLAALLQEN
jgi:deoxyribodipyrimidine photo-lyase